jgi:galactokinase
MTFAQTYGTDPSVTVRAPGRVNIIGDHTDYHDGFVLPIAIQSAIVLEGSPRSDRLVNVQSDRFGTSVCIEMDALEPHSQQWARYFQAVIAVLKQRHLFPGGANVTIRGDLSMGSGLSSSSALVVGFIALFAALYDLPLQQQDLALMGRDAEHLYGTTGGIMDQFIISHARAGHALLLDTRALAYQYIPLPDNFVLVIANTNMPHDQLTSPFALRRHEAESSLSILQAAQPGLKALRDVSPMLLEQQEALILAAPGGDVLWRRARHVVAENLRVLAVASALLLGDMGLVGDLMIASHKSLRDDYEASSPELDAMVEAALDCPGCLGARMTGGGFGGSTVNLVHCSAVNGFCASLANRYRSATGIEPSLLIESPSDGVEITVHG